MQRAVSLKPATSDRLQERLAREQSERRLPSVVAGVVRDKALAWSRACGDVATEDATEVQYRMGSITKTFVAVCVMRLRDDGALALSDPASRHLPELPPGLGTVAQLLSHTSGLRAETDAPWWERTPGRTWDELVDLLGSAAVRHRPGSRFHYSNVGFAILGELLARLHGSSWSDVVRVELLEPLGMGRTTPGPVAPFARGVAVHPYADVVLREPEHAAGAMASAGQLWSTVSDLARWGAFLVGDAAGLLSSDTLAEMRQPLTIDDRPGAPWTAAHGLGIQVFNLGGRRFVGHGGSMPGHLATVRADVESGDSVVIVTNTTSGLSQELAGDLFAILRDDPRAPEPWQPSPVRSEVLEITGCWYLGPTPHLLRACADDHLELEPLGASGRASRFRPLEDGSWLGLDGYFAGEHLRTVRSADGTVPQLDLASFVLTRVPYDPSADIPGGVDPGGWKADTRADQS